MSATLATPRYTLVIRHLRRDQTWTYDFAAEADAAFETFIGYRASAEAAALPITMTLFQQAIDGTLQVVGLY